jgi:hypothetical protein
MYSEVRPVWNMTVSQETEQIYIQKNCRYGKYMYHVRAFFLETWHYP